MDRASRDALENEFGVDYVVFKRPFDVRQIKGEVAFMNDSYLVLKVHDETIAL